ncbi:hypothetical protein FAVG1_12943 [Fusarium avenaceum]|nr:hypothetical protein FAVG1_12943 [Fusarium avenaceum]
MDVETKDMADELAAIHSLDSLCKKVQDTHTQACNSKYGNADKSLAQLSDKRLSKNPELYPELTDLKARIRDHQTLDAGEFAEYKHLSKQLYRDTLRNFFGVVVNTPVGASPLLVQEELHPTILILDEAGTMNEMTTMIPIMHFTPSVLLNQLNPRFEAIDTQLGNHGSMLQQHMGLFQVAHDKLVRIETIIDILGGHISELRHDS